MNRSRKLTFVISTLSSGGAERVLSQLANYFAQKGNQVTILTFAQSSSVPFYDLRRDVEVVNLGVLANNSKTLLSRISFIFRRFWRLRNYLKDHPPEAVISFMDITNITTLISTLGLGIKIVVSERSDPHYHAVSIVKSILRYLTYPLAHTVIVQTANAKRYFFSFPLKKPVQIIPNPVSKFSNAYEVRSLVKRISSVGRLDSNKNHKTLIKAFARLTKVHTDLELIIYGEGEERGNLEALVVELGLGNRVHLPGITKNVESELLKADLFVFPSQYEGFPNALCEALGVGLPIIASGCSGNVDVITDGENGLLFEALDVDALYKLMERMVTDFDLRFKLSSNARGSLKAFEEEGVFDLWERVLEGV